MDLSLEKENLIKKHFNPKSFHSILKSSKNFRYRNNTNFSFGLDKCRKICIGPLQKDKTVIPAILNPLCSDISVKICEFIIKWILEFSTLDIVHYKKSLVEGFWRHITIRNNRKNEIMIVFHLQNMNYFEDIWEQEKQKLILDLVSFIEVMGEKLISLYYQNSNTLKETRNNDPFVCFYSNGNYCEYLDNYKFIISPGSFFQVNTETAEIIYKKILELSNLNKSKVVFDICCGISTIGIFLAPFCKYVYGIDINNSSILDGRRNIKINNVNNISLVCGKAEVEVPYILKQLDNEAVAIVNPPRSGLHPSVLECLEKNNINQIIYLSCNIKTLIRDLKLLKKYIVDYVVPIDQFPGTVHCEILVRLNKI